METKTFKLPSGNEITIRESNGEDEGILSNVEQQKDNSHFASFLSRIVVTPKSTPTEIQGWKTNDKYYAMLMHRIFNIGEILKFTQKFEEGGPEVPFEENLLNYMLEETPSKPGDPTYNPYRAKPHLHGIDTQREFTTKSGKKLKYDFLNGAGEKYLMLVPKLELNDNHAILARNVQWFNETGKWQPLENFSILSSRDMAEIRADIRKHDEQWEMITKLTNPQDGKSIFAPLIAISDFLAPGVEA